MTFTIDHLEHTIKELQSLQQGMEAEKRSLNARYEELALQLRSIAYSQYVISERCNELQRQKIELAHQLAEQQNQDLITFTADAAQPVSDFSNTETLILNESYPSS